MNLSEKGLDEFPEHVRNALRVVQEHFDLRLSDLLATTRQAAGSEEWQPIETAPKDGDLFLAWRAGYIPYVTSYLGENHFSRLGPKRPAPTYWRPLPSPPQEPRHD